MKESPILPKKFRFTIFDRWQPLDNQGAAIGTDIAFKLCTLYTILIIPFILFPLVMSSFPNDMRDGGQLLWEIVARYLYVGVMALIIFVVGLIPSVMIGGIGGRLIGYYLRFFRKKLPLRRLIWHGFLISSLLLLLRLAIPYCFAFELWTGSHSLKQLIFADLHNRDIWVAWFIPNLIAFFALWWVGYRVNEQMPSPNS